MLDVLHYLFEEDNYFVSGEQMDARNKTRTDIYRNLYDREYKYDGKKSASPAQYEEYGDEEVLDEPDRPFNPRAEPTKGFVPATEFDLNAASPFGSVLDAPL